MSVKKLTQATYVSKKTYASDLCQQKNLRKRLTSVKTLTQATYVSQKVMQATYVSRQNLKKNIWQSISISTSHQQPKNEFSQICQIWQIGRVISFIVILCPIVELFDSNILHWTNQSDNSSAELITFHARRLSVKALLIDCEICKYFICWKEQWKFNCCRTHVQSFAIHTYNRTGLQVVAMLPWVLNKLVSVFV